MSYALGREARERAGRQSGAGDGAEKFRALCRGAEADFSPVPAGDFGERIKKFMAKRGGARPGAGRPPEAKDRAAEARVWAKRFWEANECDKELAAIVKGGDLAAKARVLTKLMEYIHGKPEQPVSGQLDANVTIVNDIPKAKR